MNFATALASCRQLSMCAAMAAVVMLAGCKVGPNYKPPPAPVAPTWIDYHDQRLAAGEADLSHWWSVFHDPILDSLIGEAYGQNLSLRTAGERIIQARARRDVVAGNFWPQVQEAAGTYTFNKASNQTANAFNNQWFQHWDAGFNASWELDFWGR